MAKDETEKIGVRVPKELADLARKVGGGNLSEGVRLALEYLAQRHTQKPTQEQVNDAIRTLAEMQDEATP